MQDVAIADHMLFEFHIATEEMPLLAGVLCAPTAFKFRHLLHISRCDTEHCQASKPWKLSSAQNPSEIMTRFV